MLMAKLLVVNARYPTRAEGEEGGQNIISIFFVGAQKAVLDQQEGIVANARSLTAASTTSKTTSIRQRANLKLPITRLIRLSQTSSISSLLLDAPTSHPQLFMFKIFDVRM